jgi:hypothetical protein
MYIYGHSHKTLQHFHPIYDIFKLLIKLKFDRNIITIKPSCRTGKDGGKLKTHREVSSGRKPFRLILNN